MSSTAAPDAPLRFRNPPGWPHPTPAWVAEHQGWQPPSKWTPVAGAPHAPHNWVFWEHNPGAWSNATRRFTAAARAGAVAGWTLASIGVILSAAAVLTATPWAMIVAAAIAVVGTIGALAGHVSLRQANKRAYLAVALASRQAARGRAHQEEYLGSVRIAA